jgi:pilus assembly protein Flp/PilA
MVRSENSWNFFVGNSFRLTFFAVTKYGDCVVRVTGAPWKCHKDRTAYVHELWEGVMRNVLKSIERLGRDEEGAALVEYTVLLGVMLVAVVGTIVLVGGWVNTKWTALLTALSAN